MLKIKIIQRLLAFILLTGRVGDYNRVDKELMFSAAVTTIRIDVNITNDRIVEETETFSLQLDLRSVSGQANVALSNDTAIVSILDDDGDFINCLSYIVAIHDTTVILSVNSFPATCMHAPILYGTTICSTGHVMQHGL